MIGGRLNVLAAIQPGPAFFVAFHDCPERIPCDTNELKYDGYRRIEVPRTAEGWTVANKAARNAQDLVWPQITDHQWVRVTHIALWNQQRVGNLIAWLEIENGPVVFGLLEAPVIQKGQISIVLPATAKRSEGSATLKEG